MATGMELLLAAALCLACPNDTVRYPTGLVYLNEKWEPTTKLQLKPLEDKLDTRLDDVPIETLETIALKEKRLAAQL